MSRRIVSKKASRPKGSKAVVQKKSSSSDNINLTIRLSDIGIIKRSPSELDLQIQGVRIANILETTINKLQIAVCLPRLLRSDACQLRQLMVAQDVEFIITICSKYLQLVTPSRLDKSDLAEILSSIDRITLYDPKQKNFLDKYGAVAKNLENLIDPQMALVMEMLWNNRPLREKVLREFQLIQQNPNTVLVNCLISLKEVSDYRFGMSAIEERNREGQLRKAWKANTLLEENIIRAQELLNKQRKEFGQQLEMKTKIIREYENKIQALNECFKDVTKHTVQENEREMAEDCLASKLRQIDLAAEAKTVTHQYEALLVQHLAYERGLRAKRFKVESQLCSWLTKYDGDMGERQAEFEAITKGYEEEKAEMEALQINFNEQEEEYVQLMAEKLAEEQRIWEERAYKFLKSRSARKIQRCWRAYRQRKIDKKKAKKAKAKAKKEKSAEKLEEGGEGGEEAVTAPPPPPPEKVGKDKKGAKGKAKGKGKGKKEKLPPSEGRGPDFEAALEDKFGGEIMGEIHGEEFNKKEVVVDLTESITE